MKDSVPVQICGTEYKIKPLTVRQALRVFKMLSGFKNSVKPGQDNASAVLSVFMEADEKLPEIVSLLAGQDIAADKVDGMTMVELSALAAAIAEVNNIAEIAANFQRATAALRQQEAVINHPAK